MNAHGVAQTRRVYCRFRPSPSAPIPHSSCPLLSPPLRIQVSPTEDKRRPHSFYLYVSCDPAAVSNKRRCAGTGRAAAADGGGGGGAEALTGDGGGGETEGGVQEDVGAGGGVVLPIPFFILVLIFVCFRVVPAFPRAPLNAHSLSLCDPCRLQQVQAGRHVRLRSGNVDGGATADMSIQMFAVPPPLSSFDRSCLLSFACTCACLCVYLCVFYMRLGTL